MHVRTAVTDVAELHLYIMWKVIQKSNYSRSLDQALDSNLQVNQDIFGYKMESR